MSRPGASTTSAPAGTGTTGSWRITTRPSPRSARSRPGCGSSTSRRARSPSSATMSACTRRSRRAAGAARQGCRRPAPTSIAEGGAASNRHRRGSARRELHHGRVKEADPVQDEGEKPEQDRDRDRGRDGARPGLARAAVCRARFREAGELRDLARDHALQVVEVLLEDAIQRLAPLARVLGKGLFERLAVLVEDLPRPELDQVCPRLGHLEYPLQACRSASEPLLRSLSSVSSKTRPSETYFSTWLSFDRKRSKSSS